VRRLGATVEPVLHSHALDAQLGATRVPRADALDEVEQANYDVVFLDEMMPGMTGLETLAQIKQMRPNLPVVMITKSEEEHIMEEAIAASITTKPAT